MTLPGPERILVAALTADGFPEVATRLHDTFPAIRVTSLGGAPRPTINTGNVECQVEVWGAGADPAHETVAADLAQQIEQAVESGSLVGVYTAGKILGAWMVGGIVHSPDPTTHRERYFFTIGMMTQ